MFNYPVKCNLLFRSNRQILNIQTSYEYYVNINTTSNHYLAGAGEAPA